MSEVLNVEKLFGENVFTLFKTGTTRTPVSF